MKTITKIEATKLAIGMQSILLDIAKEQGREAKYPIRLFEEMIVKQKAVSKKDAEKVTEAIINTGIIRWELGSNSFVL
jgi:SOS-response transcriptional repressor LexA